MIEKCKKMIRKNFSNRAIMKNIKESRMMFVGLGLGIGSMQIIKSGMLSLVPTAMIAAALVFILAFIDFKLSKKFSN